MEHKPLLYESKIRECDPHSTLNNIHLWTHTLVSQSFCFQILKVTISSHPGLGSDGILSANLEDYQTEILLFTHSEMDLIRIRRCRRVTAKTSNAKGLGSELSTDYRQVPRDVALGSRTLTIKSCTSVS